MDGYMKLKLLRYSDNGKSTLGLMFIDNKWACYCLEDEYRDVKVLGETRIPAGIYNIDFRKVDSGMTGKYRKQFSWFTWHLMLQNVPGFKYVYIHKGNKEKHTEGCILIADNANNNQIQDGFIGNSTQAFKRIYAIIADELNNGNEVEIEVIDYDRTES